MTAAAGRQPRRRGNAGFTLIEVLVAALVLVSVAISVAHLTGVSVRSGLASREQTFTGILAAAKVEQLRSLTWSYAPLGPPAPRTDLAADLSLEPAMDGGPGLSASPDGTLARNVPPYVDHLDARGRRVGNGADPPGDAVYTRRWSVRPLPRDPGRTLILSVLVSSVAQDRSRQTVWTARSGTETLLVTLLTRKGR